VDELLCATSVGSFSNNEFVLFSRTVEHHDARNGSKIFLSRSKLSRNDEELEQEILKVLLPEGFVIVTPDELPIQEQIKVIRGASTIVSFHGGALSHLVWCNKGTKVLEIFNHPYRSYDFARIAIEGGLTYSSLDTSNQGFDSKNITQFLGS
jgi:capsular polysaccharide biosynthesis protein